MKTTDYDYSYPDELIATEPASPRSSCRLLMFDRSQDELIDGSFDTLPDLLDPSDVLVVNKTRVIPARFFAQKKTGAKLEGLFFQTLNDDQIKVWFQGRVKEGEEILFTKDLVGKLVHKRDRDLILRIDQNAFLRFLREQGEPALPPYIRRRRRDLNLPESQTADRERYQSLLAENAPHFSVAAPTALLHFDQASFDSLQQRGVQIETLALHIGAGTFLPLEHNEIEKNSLHTEIVEIDPECWNRLLHFKNQGRRLVAVGTTVTRSLEAAWRRSQQALPIDFFETDLFIYPPYEFKMVDSLITNFHQPKSSLLLLVDAFTKNRWRPIYDHAIEKRYRLFSYGDALWIQ